MRVIAAFDDLRGDEASDLGDAFWLANTPSNRKLAEAAWASKRYDPNSAVFEQPPGAVCAVEVVELLDDIDLHHPGWREIAFKGADLTPELEAALDGRGDVVRPYTRGFILER